MIMMTTLFEVNHVVEYLIISGISQVLRLFHFLVKFGYYGSEDIKKLLKPLLIILECKHDKPFPPDTDKGLNIKHRQSTFILKYE